jgi:hypothetical protein
LKFLQRVQLAQCDLILLALVVLGEVAVCAGGQAYQFTVL